MNSNYGVSNIDIESNSPSSKIIEDFQFGIGSLNNLFDLKKIDSIEKKLISGEIDKIFLLNMFFSF